MKMNLHHVPSISRGQAQIEGFRKSEEILEKFGQDGKFFESPSDEPAANERSTLHGNLSAVQKRNNQSKEAIGNASEALRLNPKYLKVRIRRAELYEETDAPHEALEDWKEIQEQDPSNKNAKKGE